MSLILIVALLEFSSTYTLLFLSTVASLLSIRVERARAESLYSLSSRELQSHLTPYLLQERRPELYIDDREEETVEVYI